MVVMIFFVVFFSSGIVPLMVAPMLWKAVVAVVVVDCDGLGY